MQHSDPEHKAALPPETRLRQYEILSVLGVGGFGVTYLAEDTDLHACFAVKEYLPNEFAMREGVTVHPKSAGNEEDYRWGLDRFLEEARNLAKFRHANIVRVHQIFEDNNTAYMVLDYEDGLSFEAHLQSLSQPPSEPALGAIIAPLLDALKHMHADGLLHRDISPDNIIIRADGSPVLLDFGAARQAIGIRSRSISAIVKAGYSPPEQYSTRGGQGAYTDIYALAAVLYRAISGHPPPEGSWRITEVATGNPDPMTRLSAEGYSGEFIAAIESALSINAKDRPQDVGQWLRMLGGESPSVDTAPVPSTAPDATPPSPQNPKPEARPSHKKPLVIIAVLLLFTALFFGGNHYQKWQEQQRIVAEQEQQRIAADEEKQRIAAEEEKQRIAAEQAARLADETAQFMAKVGRPPSPTAKDANDWTDLHYAATLNFTTLAEHLLQSGAKVDAKLKSDNKLMTDGLKTTPRLFGRNYDGWHRDGDTPLHYAAANDADKIATLLIQKGADINAKNGPGDTPLHFTAWNDAGKVAALLIKKSADINAKNKYGETPLHGAARDDAGKVAALLIQKGADINAKNDDGATPLHLTAWLDAGKVAALLIQKGADINAKNGSGATPLHYAAVEDADKVAALLIQKGADINAKRDDGATPLHFTAWLDAGKVAALLIQKGADINAKNGSGATPLHYAAVEDADKVAALLIQKGADINAKRDDGDTPLHVAAWKDADKVAALLIQKGADINAKNNKGYTPLHHAALKDAGKVAALLIQNGADINATNDYGETPLHFAKQTGSTTVEKLLKRNGGKD
ncbi:ankyrin repeat domain-containing protein [Candidatus Spongiihabitans sp.]|uniref:ankyrin repeat domain-containing protein n=1 Tax=Candidatus Spongiihabitans sp. TaxID=3101308 RepID=UPI003C7C785F